MKNIVFIVSLKDTKKPNRSNPYQYSINSWKTWCDKNNSELMSLIKEIDFQQVDDLNSGSFSIFLKKDFIYSIYKKNSQIKKYKIIYTYSR